MFNFLSIDDFNFSNKIVGVRVDINSPIVNNKIINNERIKAAAITIKELSDKGAKQVILAHQGRNGKEDCLSLKNHIKFLEKETKKKLKFSKEIYSKKVLEEIQDLKQGEILLLDNLRFIDDETNPQKKENKIKKLEKYFNYYIFDAFSLAHREHTSVIGFQKIPNIAGRQMEHEILSLNLIENSPKPHVYLFGGAKADDLIPLIEKGLKKDNSLIILLTGIIGEIAILSKGYNLGKKENYLKENNLLNIKSKLNNLLKKYPNNIFFPKDVSLLNNKKRIEIKLEELKKFENILNDNLTQDIGEETIEYYSKIIKNAGSIYVKGPAGNFEEKEFQKGTKELMKTICSSNSFTFMGGGHSVSAAQMFNLKNKFSYISLAGGALVKFLSNEKLSGIEILEKSYKKNIKEKSDFTIIGSNVIDTYIDIPEPLSKLVLGDKIKIQNNFKQTLGGGGINTSISISRLGGKVTYLGKISKESQNFIEEELYKNNVEIFKIKYSNKPAAKSIILDSKQEDRVILTYRGQNSYLLERDFDINQIQSQNIYFSALSKESFKTQLSIAKKVKRANNRTYICYNPSSYLTKSEHKLNTLLNYIDIVVLNYEEAQEITKKNSINDCLIALKQKISKIVVITNGKQGSYAYDGKKQYFQKAIIPKKIIDTTGAGDCFASTFFYFYVKGYSIKNSLFYATKNASSVVEHKGPLEGLKYFNDLIE